MAPELYYDKLRSDNKTDAADVYSFGVFLWELFSNGEKPFGGKSVLEVTIDRNAMATKGSNIKLFVLTQILRTVLFGTGLEPPSAAPPSIRELVGKCVSQKASERPSAKEIVQTILHAQAGSQYRAVLFYIRTCE